MTDQHRCYLGYFTALLMDVSKHGNIRSYILVLNQKPIQFFMISTIPLKTFSFALEKPTWQLTQFMLSEKDVDRLHDLYSVAPRYLQRSNNLISWTSYHCSKLLSESKNSLAEEIYHRIKISSGAGGSPQICYLFSDGNNVDVQTVVERHVEHSASKEKAILTERKRKERSTVAEPSRDTAALTASPKKRKKLTTTGGGDKITNFRRSRERFAENMDNILDDIFTRDATIRKLTSNECVHDSVTEARKQRGRQYPLAEQPYKHSSLLPQFPRQKCSLSTTPEVEHLSFKNRQPANCFPSLERRDLQAAATNFPHPRKRLYIAQKSTNDKISLQSVLETGRCGDNMPIGYGNTRLTRSFQEKTKNNKDHSNDDSSMKTKNNINTLLPPFTPSQMLPPPDGDRSLLSDDNNQSDLCDSFNKQFSPYVVVQDCKKKPKFRRHNRLVDKDGTY